MRDEKKHLAGDGSAAGVRHGAALRAGVFTGAVEVQIPGPVRVAVPPTALELNHKGGTETQADRRTDGRTDVYLERWFWSTLDILPAWASLREKPRLTNVPVCADGGEMSHEETTELQEVCVFMKPLMWKILTKTKNK